MKIYSSSYYHRTADSLRAFRLLAGMLWEFKHLFYKFLVIAVILEVLAMGARVIFAQVLTSLEGDQSHMLGFWLLVILVYDAVFITFDVILVRTIVQNVGYRLWHAVTVKIMKHVSRLGADFYSSVPASKIMDRVKKISNIVDLAEQASWTVISHMIQVVVSIILLLIYFPGSVPLVIISIVAFFAATGTLIKVQTPSRRRRRDIDEDFVEESLSRLIYTNNTLVTNSALTRTIDHLDKGYKKLTRVGLIELNYALTGSGLTREVALFLGRRAILAISILGVITGMLTIPELVLVHTIVETMFIGMWGVARFIYYFIHESESIIKLQQLIDATPNIVAAKVTTEIPQGPLSFRMDNVTYFYPDNENLLIEVSGIDDMKSPELLKGEALRQQMGLPLVETRREVQKGHLHELSLTVKRGEVVAVVGKSGAGKSTLAGLLTGQRRPSMGKLYVSGIDILNIDPEELMDRISIVPQGTAIDLYNDTLLFNVTLGANYSLEEVIHALKAAALWDTVEKEFPALLYEVIGERGRTLSGGQQQRVAIARAILQNPDFLILDEATSALDTETELAVQKALDKLLQGRTALVIAHRLSTIRNADKIVVLDDGKMIACGSWEELVETCSQFKHLVSLQKLA